MVVRVSVAYEDTLQLAEGLPNIRRQSRVCPKVSCHLTPCPLASVEQEAAPIWDLNKLARYCPKIGGRRERGYQK